MLSTRDLGSKGWLASNDTGMLNEGLQENVNLLHMLLGQQDTYVNQTSETLMMITKDLLSLSAKLGASSKQMRQLGELINDTSARVEARLLSEANEQQQLINDYFDALQNCNRRHQKDIGLLRKLQKTVSVTIKSHKLCRIKQAAMQEKSNDCNEELEIVHRNKNSTKRSMVDLDDKVHTLAKLMCGGPTDAPVNFAKNKADEFRKAKRFFAKLEVDHKRALQEFSKQKRKCLQKQHVLLAVTDQCNSAQTELMHGQCLYRQTEHKKRDAYQTCYYTKLSEYDEKVRCVKKNTVTRKAQWQSLKLVSCILKAFFSHSEEEVPKTIAECQEKEFGTGQVSIEHEPLNKMAKILRVPPLAPCAEYFKRDAFSGIPESIPLLECLSCPMPAESHHTPLKKHCVSMVTGKHMGVDDHADAGHFLVRMDGKAVFDGYLPFGDPVTSCISAVGVPRIEVEGHDDAWMGSMWYRTTNLTAGIGSEPESEAPWKPLMLATGFGATPIFIGAGMANGTARAVCENANLCSLTPAASCVHVLTTNTKAFITILFDKTLKFSGNLIPAPGEEWAELVECSAAKKPKIQVSVPKDKGPWDGTIEIMSDATLWEPKPMKHFGVPITDTTIDAGQTWTLEY